MDQQPRCRRLGHHRPCYPAEPDISYYEPNGIDRFFWLNENPQSTCRVELVYKLVTDAVD